MNIDMENWCDNVCARIFWKLC